ncbi:MAG: hypothetical protein HYV52_03095 [Parcubacteria group bacterium]|nr:hypothetical protein [Parcubacteria group bacterium]
MNTIGHQKIINFFKKSLASGKVAHSYFFSGEASSGKLTMAEFFARTLLKSENLSNNPDFKIIDKNSVGIDDIRDLINFLTFKSYQNFKVAIINNAELMSHEAQSAILKTLEEPAPKTVLILTSSSPSGLLPTILSRTLQINFRPVPGTVKDEKKIEVNREETREMEKIFNSSLFGRFEYLEKKCVDDKEKAGDFLNKIRVYFRQKLLKEVEAGETEAALKTKNYLKFMNEVEEALKFNVNSQRALEILMAKL